MLSAMTGKRWMGDEEFTRRWLSGEPAEDISARNKRLTGWGPVKASVSGHAKSLGLPPRNTHCDLLPGEIRPEHRNRYQLMLEAEDRRRKAARKYGDENALAKLSETDRRYVRQLDALLNGRGDSRETRLVIGYDADHIYGGWFLTDRQPWDTDIVRRSFYPEPEAAPEVTGTC
jgi:hypothetical protein